MKRFLLPVLLFAGVSVTAQKINLANGKQIVITASAEQEMDMSAVGVQMKNNSTSTSIVEVKSSDNNKYNAVYKVTKMKMSMDMMGQQNSYDSEKAEDKDSQMGKMVGEKIGKEQKVTVDKNTGKATMEQTTEDKDEANANPFAGLMQSFGPGEEGSAVETAFFVLPAGKKVGDVWSDSSSHDKMKEVKTYTLKSLNGNDAIVSLFSKLEGTSNVEAQGMMMDITISAKTEGTIFVDVKNSLVKKRTNVTDLTGNIDMMGQSVPMISKVTTTTEYN